MREFNICVSVESMVFFSWVIIIEAFRINFYYYYFFTIAQFTISLKVWKVACGWLHTIFITEDRKAFSCGTNEHGQLGRTLNELEIGKYCFSHIDNLASNPFPYCWRYCCLNTVCCTGIYFTLFCLLYEYTVFSCLLAVLLYGTKFLGLSLDIHC